MKNINIKASLFLFTFLIFTSCKKEEFTDMTEINLLTGYNDLKSKIGIYADFLIDNPVNLSIYTTVSPDIPKEFVDSKFSAGFAENSERKNLGGSFFIDNFELKCNEGENKLYLPGIEMPIKYGEGKNVRFSYKNANGIIDFDTEMYIPKSIYNFKFSNRRYDKVHERYKAVKPYEIQWEGDSKNKNGILVWITWDGTIIGNHPSIRSKLPTVDRAIFIKEDNGKATLPNSFFEGIPEGGYVSINVNKGNIKLIDTKVNGKLQRVSLLKRSITTSFEMF